MDLVEILIWQQLGLHAKPVALVDVSAFWDLVACLRAELTAAGFMPEATARSLVRGERRC